MQIILTDNEFNELEIKFWRKVKKTENCHEWLGSKDSEGYGVFSYRIIKAKAAVIVWYINKKELPKNLMLHTCDHKWCVKFEHLYDGTHSNNAFDRVKHGKHLNARKTHCKRGHLFDESNIIWSVTGGRACRICVNTRQKLKYRDNVMLAKKISCLQ